MQSTFKLVFLCSFLAGTSAKESHRLRGERRPADQNERQAQECGKDPNLKLASGGDGRRPGGSGASGCVQLSRKPDIFVNIGISTLAPTDAPVSLSTGAPVSTPTDMPVAAPTETPVSAPTDMPVAETAAPVASVTLAPTNKPTFPLKIVTAAPVPTGPRVNVCGRTSYWDFADGKLVIPCLVDEDCDGYKKGGGTPCCSVPRCICASTPVVGQDKCGNFA